MGMTHITENHELLLDYLYEEGDPAERLRVARHLQECAGCSVAVLELQSVRGLLKEWTPPRAALGFNVPADGTAAAEDLASASADAAAAPAPRSRWPVWAQAAAAVGLFAAGMAASQVRIEYDGGALTVRSRVSAQPVADMVIHRGTDIPLPAEEPAAAAPSGTTNIAYGSGRSPSSEELMRRVRLLIDQSESRQQHQLALRLTDLLRDIDTQRQADLLQVQQSLGQLEGQTGAEVAQQRALLNSLVKVSQQGGSK